MVARPKVTVCQKCHDMDDVIALGDIVGGVERNKKHRSPLFFFNFMSKLYF